MRQALIVGVRPILHLNRSFPVVPLGPGGWRVNVENGDGSKIRLTVTSSKGIKLVEMVNGSVPLVDGPCTISAEIVEAGKEDTINVVATSLEK